MREWAKKNIGVVFPEAEEHGQLTSKPAKAGGEVIKGVKKFADLTAPMLVIVASPHDNSAGPPIVRYAREACSLSGGYG